MMNMTTDTNPTVIKQAMTSIKQCLEVIEKEMSGLSSTDSIEFGSPSKGGKVKVYGDASNPDQFREKIENVINLKYYAEVYDQKLAEEQSSEQGEL